jgi:hypothetical protein
VAQRFRPLPADSEFVRMMDYILDLIHDLLESGLETFSDSSSSEGSHHPSRECFMAETSDGHASSASDSGKTPREVPVRATVGRKGPASGGGGLSLAPARMTTAGATIGTQRELEEARHGL